MNAINKPLHVLFIGESWHIHMIHSKGYDSFTSSKYEEGATYLLKCLRDAEVSITYMPAHQVQIAFPEDPAELEKYDVIVISDIGSNTFLLQNDTFYQSKIKPDALDMIKEYVCHGGGLLMIGGYLSFMGIEAKANYKNTVLADVLPVIMFDGDDRVEKPSGVYASPVTNGHETVNEFTDWPVFLGYNKVESKDNATIALTIDNDPLLVYGNFEKGKTACFMSDCSPHWGSHEFMNWKYYTSLWVNILRYISKN
ncbi:MAG: glutamine amidotransferase [Klebsiella huaxiensis]|uniref:glutamine amidotransferase n=1 Tax=Klebsiella huaxiensis TaxID=2153354 RepID=UPI0026EB676B|nr:glutamine amidotransferase [Klebsiella huaxiensis]WEJ91159.1 MAG: glutamine amidotransferase [Klebsiella huaxiensis]